MILEMKVPSPGESISEVEIAEWLVKDGDFVEKDQTIAEVDSDKATLDLPAEESGVITLKAEEGDAVAVGQVVCLIDTDAKAPKAKKEEEQEKPITIIKSVEDSPVPKLENSFASGTPSPAAAKILSEKNISASNVSGSGRGGRITKDDALKALPKVDLKAIVKDRNIESKKLSMLRRKVAQRLVAVKNQTAMLTTFNEVNMTPIFELRKKYKEQFKEKHGVGLGFMSFFTKATVQALQEFPDVNSMIDGDQQIKYDFFDISIAVSGPKGLMVPVVRDAQELSFSGVEKEIKRLAIRARDGEITVDEMTGGTFTITNGGVFGSMLSTPIINPPQSAILGMHNIVERPIAVNGKVEIHPIMYLALSYDHRIIDGKESVGFLVKIKEALENPISELMKDNINKALEI
ncbi:2-oxoglutarate dehydrogenase complex dihydrolipoyllysine-residue succinyltransferase [Flavobacteriaceae bacterium]|nr:2-oxoglutarate dehydrogenase complex dihydrolipoyllysine-residue succinyltransferase [Flavobacteriaceae bacterium]MDA9124882.1 2-oxoglutarate dehydrogenase complex dihydrolipoyllysine-residue succinyltransferase [Flavobacteriaceae bacterium]MDA9241834.1 2-oxoglutarate dehydrogenase complex dihydrolipoyllysine-residue succinyltransferase [Flavobacteriaceae bacterium]MDB4113826.1 2-oxoglutarate dehydrogenase complex dihydrolipoyllysine-residue succinyltransferase [Flavobacteriaceae bacterium]M